MREPLDPAYPWIVLGTMFGMAILLSLNNE